MKRILTTLTVLLLTVSFVFAQQPPKSPRIKAKEKNFEVNYGQPSKRGRVIFGELVPYGEVWRTGANEATEITFKKDCIFGGQPVKAGTYTLFTIPNKTEWTVILNKQLKQWGAYDYEKIKDKNVLEVKVPTQNLPAVQEKFTIAAKPDSVKLEWDQTAVAVPVKF